MPSFDIVSEVELHEVRNAVENAQREVTSRWDFRNITATIELNEKNNSVKMTSESDFRSISWLILCGKNWRNAELTARL